MSRATLLKGALWLTVATFLSKVLGSVFRIPLQNIAGDEVLGIFSVVYPVYMSVLTLTVAGIPLAISKLISAARAEGRIADIYAIYRTAAILAIAFGLVGFSALFFFADTIARFLGGSLVTYSVIAVSFTLIFAPYMAVYRGFFQGYEDMKPTAVSQVLEQFARVIVILAAALFLTSRSYPLEIVSGGVMIGSVVGVLFSLVYLLLVYIRRKPFQALTEKRYSFSQFRCWTKRILAVSLPICFGALTMALLNVVDSLTVPTQLLAQGKTEREAAFLYGIYGRGQALVQIAVVFASALILPLIPAITKALKAKNVAEASKMMSDATTLTHLTSWPAALGLAALTIPVNFVLFGDTLGSDVIFILALSSLFTAMSVLSTGMLQGVDREKLAAMIVLVFSLVKAGLNVVLVADFGIVGAALSTLVTYVGIQIANFFFLYKTVPFRWIARSHVVFAFASIVMAGVLAFLQWKLQVHVLSRFVATVYVAFFIGAGALIFAVIVFALKGVDRDMLRSLPFLSKVVSRTGGSGRQSGKDGMTLLKKGLWFIVLIALIASSPSLAKRVQVEQGNGTYEVVIPYEQFIQWPDMLEDSLSAEQALRELKEKGLTSMSIEPLTISDLVTDGVFDRVKRSEIEHEHPEASGDLPTSNGQFIKILEPRSEYIDIIENVYNNHYAIMEEEGILSTRLRVSFHAYGDDMYLFLPYEVSLNAMPIGFDEDALKLIQDAGLHIIPRLPNQFMNIQNENHYVYDMLEKLATAYDVKTIAFTGNDVVGVHDPLELRTFAKKLKELGFAIATIDFNPQRGMDALLRVGDLKQDTVRLFSMTLGIGEEKTYETEVEKGVRGYKERNIRILFINPVQNLPTGMQTYQHPGEAEVGYTYTLKMIDTLTSALGKDKRGQAAPFATFSQPFVVTVLVCLGASAFLSLTGFTIARLLGVLGGIGGLLLAVLSFIGVDIASKGLALLTAISGAVYAGLAVKAVNSWRQLVRQYVVSACLALVGAWLVIAMLYGPEFLVKVEEFRGVKVLAALPVIVVGFVLFASFLKRLLFEPVRYWHLAVMVLFAAVFAFYVWRTGNAAMTLPYELEFRQWLESVLYVRPRTSEFLIGFPLFVLGLYLTMEKKKAAPIFITLGMLGFASMVGTFTHLHTALLLSLLRTFYGLVFGFIIGLIFIALYRLFERHVYPFIQKRWHE